MDNYYFTNAYILFANSFQNEKAIQVFDIGAAISAAEVSEINQAETNQPQAPEIDQITNTDVQVDTTMDTVQLSTSPSYTPPTGFSGGSATGGSSGGGGYW